jgi:hypothetical protein
VPGIREAVACEDRTADCTGEEAHLENSTAAATEVPVARAAERAGSLARGLRAWAVSGERRLGEMEQQTLALVKEFGQVLHAGVCTVVAAGSPRGSGPARAARRRATSASARRRC